MVTINYSYSSPAIFSSFIFSAHPHHSHTHAHTHTSYSYVVKKIRSPIFLTVCLLITGLQSWHSLSSEPTLPSPNLKLLFAACPLDVEGWGSSTFLGHESAMAIAPLRRLATWPSREEEVLRSGRRGQAGTAVCSVRH